MAVLCIATIGLILAAQNNPAAASTAVVSSHAVAAPAATFPADAPSLGAIPDGPAGGTVCGDYGAGFKDVTFTVTGMTGPLTDVQVSSSITHTWVGDLDGALDMLESVMPRMQSRSLLITMLADPDMDPLRDHPRFKRMIAEAMKRTGLTEEMIPVEVRRSPGDATSAAT